MFPPGGVFSFIMFVYTIFEVNLRPHFGWSREGVEPPFGVLLLCAHWGSFSSLYRLVTNFRVEGKSSNGGICSTHNYLWLWNHYKLSHRRYLKAAIVIADHLLLKMLNAWLSKWLGFQMFSHWPKTAIHITPSSQRKWASFNPDDDQCWIAVMVNHGRNSSLAFYPKMELSIKETCHHRKMEDDIADLSWKH